MFGQIINITIPKDVNINEEINTFTPEENYLMLKIGSECLLESRKAIVNLTQKEMFHKIKEDFKDEIQHLELDIIVQKELNKKMEENMEKIYSFQIDILTKKIECLNKQINSYELENKDFIRIEIEKTKEKCDFLLEQKDKQIDKLTDTYEKLIIEKNKSVNKKGVEGEKKFKDYALTFKDFKGFELIDKHTQGGEGDFHLHFDEFDILIDAKNYKSCVPGREREKIKNDLIKNEHINFAWLVSLNTSIDKFDKAPIMVEWITTDKCILHINNLTSFEDPKKILRIAWFYCNELMKLITYTSENSDLSELKDVRDRQYKIVDKIKNARKNIREINTTITVFKKQVDMLDYELKEMIEYQSDNIVESNYSILDEWWVNNIEVSKEECQIISTELWMKFKQDNKELIKEFDLTTEKFKEYIKLKIPLNYLELKSNLKGAIIIKGIKYKEKVEKIEEIKLDLELDKKVVKKKLIKKKEYYFNKEEDEKILLEYQDLKKDIMLIASNNEIRPWQVVSVLMKNIVIVNRDQARGYDKYKETEEYKKNIK